MSWSIGAVLQLLKCYTYFVNYQFKWRILINRINRYFFPRISINQTNLNVDNETILCNYLRIPHGGHLGKKLMVLKAWTLSCNYELKSFVRRTPVFSHLFECEEDNIAPPNLCKPLKFGPYNHKDKAEISTLCKAITFRYFLIYWTCLDRFLFSKETGN